MAKARRSMIENNYKVTDFFAQQPNSSCRAPPSSAPVLSSTAKQPGKQEQRKTTFSQTQPSAKSFTRPQSSPLRSVRKENAPPLTLPPHSSMRPPPPPDREIAYVSSSSDAPSHISMSSKSTVSADNSVVEVVPPFKQDRRHLQTYGIVSSSSPLPTQRRRSPRFQASIGRPNRAGKQITASLARKPTRKRKKPEGVQSDDGDVIDLEAMEEVIVVSTKPARIDLVTPEPSVHSRPSVPRKRACLNSGGSPDMPSSVVEVIPSSQSDERELNIPKESRKNLRDIKESVREWQLSSSQSNVLPESSDPSDGNDEKFSMDADDLDLVYPLSSPGQRERSATPVSSSKVSLQKTPQKNSPLQMPTKTSSIRRSNVSVGGEQFQIPSGSKSPSPMLGSTASSLTKVATPAKESSRKESETTRSSPGKTPHIDRVVSPDTSFPCKVRAAVDMDVLLLSQKEKAEAIIERIKADARAKAMAMPDEDSIVLGSLDDSDSELGSPTNIFSELTKDRNPCKTTGKSANSKTSDGALDDGHNSRLTDIDELGDQMNLKRCSRRTSRRSASPSCSSSTATSTRRAPTNLPTTFTSSTNTLLRKRVNPFAKLLKEKARRDRYTKIILSPELEDDVNLFDAAEGFTNGASGPGSQLRRENSDEGDFEMVVRKADKRKLFGEEDNGVVGKILEDDCKDRGKGNAVAAKLGVPFWVALSEEAKRVNLSVVGLPRLEINLEDPSLKLLQELVDLADIDGAAVILQSGLISFEDAGFMEWLFEVAICTSGSLAISAHAVLKHICESRSQESRTVVISITPVLKALSKLGARRDFLDALHLEAASCDRLALPDVLRSEALWRLSEIVLSLASEDLLHAEDVPVYFALLVAIGMDIKTDINLRLSIKRSLNCLINAYCGDFFAERGKIEVEICSKIIALTSDLSAANKEYLLSFVDGDNPVSRRVGQWVAFAMLTGDYGARLAREFVAGAPSLADVIALLDARLDSGLRSDHFNISRNSGHFDSLDYAALGHHVEVLGRVLMNIPQYVLSEKAEARAARDSEDSPRRRGRVLSKLEIIKGLLERLGNNIADTRAAHLDRSETKAVIQQLAMRIDYQRKAAYEKPKINNFFRRTSAM
ncbi:hypothetical protein ACEPAF_7957 [Sanghuangporus sanghuang]